MAKKSKIAKYRKQQMLVAKYAEIRKQLKVNHDYESLRKLPKDSNPIRVNSPQSKDMGLVSVQAFRLY
ncbi:hypothetical protein B5E73_09075 [Ligilactobacillus salivarius]|nr:hypothetical protein B5E73_09075 [Ligilactobacillus salivarius]